MELAIVTGVTGFLGSRLAQMLTLQGTHVIGLKRKTSDLGQLNYTGLANKLELHNVASSDINLGNILHKRKVSAIFHTASLARVGNSEAETIALVDTNIRFPSQLLSQAKKSGLVGCFINASTSWQSTDGKTYSPFNLYAATKEAFETVLEVAAAPEFPCVSLRLFDPYGPGDYRNKIVDLLITAILENKQLSMSPGEQKVSFVHVDDVARAFIISAELALKGQLVPHLIYSVQGNDPPCLRDFASMIGQLLNKTVPVNWGGREYRANEIMNPGSSYPSVPGWSPNINLADGIQQVVQYHQGRIFQTA